MNKVRCLLQDTGLDYQFWGEALNYVVYTENRSPTKALGVRTQFQVIYGRWPNIEHLRSFGCVEYAFIDKSMRSELKPRATKCVFLGYASQRKSYRLQNCESGRTFECPSVKFVEDGTADDNPNKSVQVDHSYTQKNQDLK
ncbi:hypothetical protein AeNC1_017545 [Aphanomyces euteiches]|nr:hypothetical protein AeNC1_017545 [Aphanomyces euteiches]